MAVPAILDIIVFKDGNLVNGKVLTNAFPIKTSYGEIVVKKKISPISICAGLNLEPTRSLPWI
jgi:hypothetical protein